MSAVQVKPVDDSLLAMLILQCGRPVGMADVPEDQTLPFMIVYPQRSDDGVYGPMGDCYGMAGLNYQVSLVGELHSQVQALEDRLTIAIQDHWPSIVGCMGPPEMRRGGIVRDSERLYRGVVAINMRSTA